jgi:hypothetical protein
MMFILFEVSTSSFQQQQHVCGSHMAQNRENKRSFYKSVAARRTKKRRAFFEKKTKKGFNALIFEFVERALKSFSVIAPWRQLLRLFLRPLFVS